MHCSMRAREDGQLSCMFPRLTYGCDSLYLDEMLWSGRFLQAKPGNEAGNEGKNEATNRVHAGWTRKKKKSSSSNSNNNNNNNNIIVIHIIVIVDNVALFFHARYSVHWLSQSALGWRPRTMIYLASHETAMRLMICPKHSRDRLSLSHCWRDSRDGRQPSKSETLDSPLMWRQLRLIASHSQSESHS